MAGRRRLGPDELALWQAVAKSVTPLKPRRRKKAPAGEVDAADNDVGIAKQPPPKRPKTARGLGLGLGLGRGPAPIAAARSPVAKPPAPLLPVPDSLSAPLPGIDKRQAERFRRGQLQIEGRIDLHGRTQIEAHDALQRFIARAAGAGKRQLLVITGKGSTKSAGGVLKSNVPRWLNEPALRRHILAIADARPEHGGTGALYVLLKRTR